jgi:hypothetical protein
MSWPACFSTWPATTMVRTVSFGWRPGTAANVQERQSRPPIEVDHLLVGMVGGFQPDKLARSFADDDDGLYGRILFAWPAEPDFKPLSNAVTEVEPDFQTPRCRSKASFLSACRCNSSSCWLGTMGKKQICPCTEQWRSNRAR